MEKKQNHINSIQRNSCLLTRNELAEILRLSEKSVRNYENQGLLPVIRIGRRRLYRLSSVLSALEKLEVGG
jgi:DNA-binding transcriptional MerR regulator